MISDYISFCENVKGFSPQTCRSYRSILRNFARFFKESNKRWSTITPDDVREFIQATSRENQASTVNVYIMTCRGFFDYLVRFKGLETNPFAGFSKIKEPKRLVAGVPENVCQQCLNNPPARSRRIKYLAWVAINIMYYEGLRISEVMNLKWSDVTEVIDVIGKGNKERIVPVAKELATLLNHERMLDEKSTYIMESWGERVRLRSLTFEINKLLLEAGCEVALAHPHALRHTFATRLACHGIPLPVLQKILGHNNLSTTEIYLSVTRDEIIQNFNRYSI